MAIQIKRIYEAPAPADGYRVLVDRVWPRGMTKEKAAIDLWDKQIAPSTELRKWFAHDPAKWEQFKQRYFAELKQSPEVAPLLEQIRKQPTITLLYSARDTGHNQAVALRDYLVSGA